MSLSLPPVCQPYTLRIGLAEHSLIQPYLVAPGAVLETSSLTPLPSLTARLEDGHLVFATPAGGRALLLEFTASATSPCGVSLWHEGAAVSGQKIIEALPLLDGVVSAPISLRALLPSLQAPHLEDPGLPPAATEALATADAAPPLVPISEGFTPPLLLTTSPLDRAALVLSDIFTPTPLFSPHGESLGPQATPLPLEPCEVLVSLAPAELPPLPDLLLG